ncbi:MAG: KH domain-containing protein [Luteolibacter sp.]
MPKRITNITSSLKQLGEIQVTEWDFMALLNKDISELELSHSLRKLGNLKVMEWDFRTVLPVVNKLANQEVDFVDLFKRTAHYKVMEWDFKSAATTAGKTTPQVSDKSLHKGPSHSEMQALMVRLKNFLQYVVVNLIDEPDHAQIRIQEIESDVVRFKLVLVKRDVAMLIGIEGHTASAIRSILKETAAMHGVHALLEILSHEDDMREGSPLVMKGG